MYTNNSNLAYDLSHFDTDERVEQRTKKRQQSHIHEIKRTAAKNGSIIKILFCSACALALFFMFLYNKVELSELAADISTETSMLSEVQTENVRLQSQLDSMVTLEKVEDYAANSLGLQKAQSSQVVNIVLNTEKMTQVETADSNIFVSAKEWVDSVLEYLGF